MLNVQGIAGPVNIEIAAGIYTGVVNFEEIPGADCSTKVRFYGPNQDSSLVVLQSVGNASSNYIIQLQGTDGLVFEYVTFFNTSTLYTVNVSFRSDADCNTFEHCRFSAPFTSNAAVSSLIFADQDAGAANDSNRVALSLLDGAGRAIYLLSQSDATNWQIEDNSFINQNGYGVFINGLHAPLIRNNTFNFSSTSFVSGIQSSNTSGQFQIIGNEFISTEEKGSGILVQSHESSISERGLLANNIISLNGTGSIDPGNGIYIRDSENIDVFFNSVALFGSDSTNTLGLFEFNNQNIDYRNNIFACFTDGQSIYTNNSTGNTYNFNDYYTTGSSLGKYNLVDQANLSDWQLASGQDAQSQNVDPGFISTINLRILNQAFDNLGTPIALVQTDIDGETRDPVNPDIGADEFSPAALDLSLESLLSPQMPFSEGLTNVSIQFKNNGADPINSTQIKWYLNGVEQSLYFWTGTLLADETINAVIGSFDAVPATPYDLDIIIDQVNGQSDSEVLNDSLIATDLYAGLSGTYTIGGTSPDFNTLNESIQAMELGSVLGPVTFDIRDGVYAEQLIFNNIPGSGANNPIVYQSESGDANTTSIDFATTTSGETVLSFEDVSYLTFKDLTLRNSTLNTSSSAMVISLRETIQHLTFDACQILAPVINTNVDLIDGDDLILDSLRIQNCELSNGRYGLILSANALDQTPDFDLIVSNNDFQNQRITAIRTFRIGASEISGNTIESTSNTADGLLIIRAQEAIKVIGNQIRMLDRPLEVNNMETAMGQVSRIANNYLRSQNNSALLIQNGCDELEFWHNTLYSEGNSPSFVLTAACIALNSRNNLITNFGTGSAIEIVETQGFDSDYNNYFALGNVLAIFDDVDLANLIAWQFETSQDGNSLNLNPLFENDDSFEISSGALNNVGIPIPEITTDIEGDVRDLVNPDIGADEYDPSFLLDASIIDIVQPVAPFSEGLQNVTAILRNLGLNSLTQVEIQWSVNGQVQPSINWSGSLAQGDSELINLGSIDFQIGLEYTISVSTNNPNGSTDEDPTNDQFIRSKIYPALLGTYELGNTNADFPSFSAFEDGINFGGVLGPVEILVQPGSYLTSTRLISFLGNTSNNPVSIRSLNGDPSEVQIENDGMAGNFIFHLDGAKYFSFESMQFIANENSSQSRGIWVTEDAKILSLNQIDFEGLTSGSAGSGTRSFLHITSPMDSVFVENCDLNGGGDNFQMIPEGSNNQIQYALLQGNNMQNNLGDGVSFNRVNSFDLVDNDFPTGRISILNADNLNPSRIISRNETNRLSIDEASNLLIRNNFFTEDVLIRDSDQIDFLGNSVRGESEFDRSSNVRLYNNIFANESGGLALTLDSDFGFNNVLSESDHNNFFSSGTNLINFDGTILTNLAAYQGLVSFDSQSLSVDPFFISATNLHVSQIALDGAGIYLPELVVDIDGQLRDAQFPDIGADEFGPLNNDVVLESITAPQSGCDLSSTEQVIIELSNLSSSIVDDLDLIVTYDGSQTLNESVSNLDLEPGETIQFTLTGTVDLSNTSISDFTVEVVFPGDADLTNNEITISINNQVSPDPIQAPGNLIPVDGAQNIGVPVNFSWTPTPNVNDYVLHIQVTGSQMFSADFETDQTSFEWNPQELGQQVSWYVEARNDCGSVNSSTQTFMIAGMPDLVVNTVEAPISGFSNQEIEVQWIVENQSGSSTGMNFWTDQIYLSANDEFEPFIDVLLGSRVNSTALLVGESYSNTATVQLPQNTVGNFFVFVVADGSDAILEFDETNNAGFDPVPINIQLPPLPDLIVNTAVAPGSGFSGTDIIVTWNVENQGSVPTIEGSWTDAVYLVNQPDGAATFEQLLGTRQRTGNLAVGNAYPANLEVMLPNGLFGTFYFEIRTDIGEAVYEDVLSLNNSGFTDSIQIILTPPPDLVVSMANPPSTVSNKEFYNLTYTVLNQGATQALPTDWTDQLVMSQDAVYNPLNPDNMLFASREINELLDPTEDYSKFLNFTVPENLNGNYFLHFITDAEDDVFEFSFENNNVLSFPIQIQSPDLLVSNIQVSDDLTSGETATFSWEVSNIGLGRKLPGSIQNKIFLSPSSVFNAFTAIEIGVANQNMNLLPGEIDTLETSLILPEGLEGPYFVFVWTDFSQLVFENGSETNNLQGVGQFNITLGQLADLEVTQVFVPDTATAGINFQVPISYRITNVGDDETEDIDWKDRVYLSPDPAWNGSNNAILLKQIPRIFPLDTAESYFQSTNIQLPPLPPGIDVNICYIYIFTDEPDDIVELGDDSNNILRGDPIYVEYPSQDLANLNVVAPDTAVSGTNIQVAWWVENITQADLLANYDYWYDGIFLSSDAVLDDNDLFITDLQIYLTNHPNTNAYADSLTINLPETIFGDQFLIVKVDHTELLEDDPDFDNNVLAHPIFIELATPRDLVIQNLDHNNTGFSGQPLEITFDVLNQGLGTTQNGSIKNRAYLSNDGVIDALDQVIGVSVFSGFLNAGETYPDTIVAMIPISAIGNFTILVKTDDSDQEYEHLAEANNVKNSAFFAVLPPPADLVVSEILIPGTFNVSELATVNWQIRNEGINPAVGFLKDAVYLSQDTILDPGDPLLGELAYEISLAPGETKDTSLTALVPGVALGDFYLIVKTDIQNNINESVEDNNVGVSNESLEVQVPLLPLDIWVPDTLASQVGQFFRIEIPNNLVGETLIVEFDSELSNANNELHVSFGMIPGRSNAQFIQEGSPIDDVFLLVPALQAGTYYLQIYGQTPNGLDQPFEIRASILTFSILSVDANSGGNTGNVTVKIKGGKFGLGMVARLTNDQLGTITSSNVQFVDQTTVFATFPLNGTDIGLYDLSLTKPNGNQAMLSDAFTIENGLAEDLIVEYLHPFQTRFNRTVSITIVFLNNGNTDIPMPTRSIISSQGAKLAYEPNLIPFGQSDLYLEFEEQGGPPGILRPGAVSSITVYARAIPFDDRHRYFIVE